MKRTSTETDVLGKKKVKFDKDNQFFSGEGEDDDDLEYGTRKRKGAVKQGYTDSDDEDGGGADSDLDSDKDDAAESESNTKEANDADDDMFAENQDKANKTRKAPQFLSKDKLDQLGAEGDHDEDIEQGVKIMPFNMDDELDEGAFDENFNYVRTRDQHEVHDKWLDGINNKYIQLAKVASDRIKARVEALDALEEDAEDEPSCWKKVLRNMKPRESVATALKRLGGPKKVPAWKKNQKKKATDVPAAAEESPEAEAERKRGLAELISVTDRLTGFGRYDVMEQTYESIVRSLRISQHLHDDWLPGDAVPITSSQSQTTSKILWEYKLGKDSEDVMGPFPGSQMMEWKQGGYFSEESGKSDVWVRLVEASTPVDSIRGFVELKHVNLETGEGAVGAGL
ncbi:hypothetical protein HDU79_005032 [Rhizoclosmatium sp. JEL0117]|nr:hypothetical protein HDU79_005032 [Rhizoclosmatium sp. JEL0117]